VDVLEGAAYPWATDPTTADDIAALVEPPSWHADAACKEAPVSVSWFPGFGESARPAVAVCRGCLVASECRAWSLAQGPGLEGIWAGMGARERQRLRGASPQPVLSKSSGRRVTTATDAER
jgi:hypothetical protein